MSFYQDNDPDDDERDYFLVELMIVTAAVVGFVALVLKYKDNF